MKIFAAITFLLTFSVAGQPERTWASLFSKPRPPAKDGFPKTWKFSSNSSDRTRIPRETMDPDEALSFPDCSKDKWHCKAGEKYCLYVPSIENNWLEASKTCSAVGGMLANSMGFEEDKYRVFLEENNVTSWCSLHWDSGRGHEFNEATNSPDYLGSSQKNDVYIHHVAKGHHCFAISPRPLDEFDYWYGKESSFYGALGRKCNDTLPYLCITKQAKFSETQRKLRLPLKVVIDIEIQKIAGPDPGTEALRCVPNFKDAYNKTDRPFNIVWILDGAYYPKEGLKHDDHSTTIIFPHKNFTKYACEVRYLGSFYGNRSQEIATPSKGKLRFLIRIRNATFPPKPLNYSRPIKELVEAINNDHKALNLSQIDDNLFEQNGSELLITYHMFSDTCREGELTDMVCYCDKQIEKLNAALNGSSINQPSPFQKSTLEAINFFRKRITSRTLVEVRFAAIDPCDPNKPSNASKSTNGSTNIVVRVKASAIVPWVITIVILLFCIIFFRRRLRPPQAQEESPPTQPPQVSTNSAPNIPRL